ANSSAVGAEVPIGSSLYICLESAEIITELNTVASSIPVLVFPIPVGPPITTIVRAIVCLFRVKNHHQKNHRPRTPQTYHRQQIRQDHQDHLVLPDRIPLLPLPLDQVQSQTLQQEVHLPV